MKTSKKDIISILTIVFLSIIISTYIVSSLIYKYPTERYTAFNSANISKFEVALKIYGIKIPKSKIIKYNSIAKSDEIKLYTAEANASSFIDIFTVISIAAILSGISTLIYLKLKKKYSIRSLQKNFSNCREQAIKKYNLIGNEFSARCIDASSYNTNLNNKKLIIWSDKENIKLINNNFTDDIGMMNINRNDIISFCRYGDFFTTLKIHQEKSCFGFIDGFISFKNTIDSKTVIHDKRETLLFVNENNSLKFIFFEPKFYDFLIHIIPQKEINFLYKLSKNGKVDELNKLVDLKKQGFINDDEFTKLKNDLLERI